MTSRSQRCRGPRYRSCRRTSGGWPGASPGRLRSRATSTTTSASRTPRSSGSRELSSTTSLLERAAGQRGHSLAQRPRVERLLVREKRLTRLSDEIAQRRRDLPSHEVAAVVQVTSRSRSQQTPTHSTARPRSAWPTARRGARAARPGIRDPAVERHQPLQAAHTEALSRAGDVESNACRAAALNRTSELPTADRRGRPISRSAGAERSLSKGTPRMKRSRCAPL